MIPGLQFFKLVLLIFATCYLAGCKVEITAPAGADVVSQSGSFRCFAGETCTVDVVDIYFDEIFSASPHVGYEFVRWKKMDWGFCPESTEPCHLFTSDFAGNELLEPYLETDLVFFLEPEVKKIEGELPQPESGVPTSEQPGGGQAEAADYRNFFGVVWRGSALDNLRFAKQMGYKHVANHGNMRKLPEAEGFKFFMLNPEITASPFPTRIELSKNYSAAERATYEQYLTWKDERAKFPNNLASGWWRDSQSFLIVYDFQQQAVIDGLVDMIISDAKELENPAVNYTFAGLMWDVQDLNGDFWTGPGDAGGEFVDLSHWTGKDSCAASNHRHDYASYSDGKAAFYKQLYQRIREAFPAAKFIGEPFLVYDRWVKHLETRADGVDLMPDMLVQEASGTDFMDDDRIYASGLITRKHVGLSTPRASGVQENLLYSAKAAVNGSWYNWFGKFGGDGDMPDYQNVYEIPARHQLIRVIPAWDNLNNIPLANRSWNGDRYTSPSSYADESVIYSRHPETAKIFAVYLDINGVVRLPANERLVSIERTDGLFMETENGINDIEYANNEIRLTSRQQLGMGYIITTSAR